MSEPGAYHSLSQYVQRCSTGDIWTRWSLLLYTISSHKSNKFCWTWSYMSEKILWSLCEWIKVNVFFPKVLFQSFYPALPHIPTVKGSNPSIATLYPYVFLCQHLEVSLWKNCLETLERDSSKELSQLNRGPELLELPNKNINYKIDRNALGFHILIGK